MQKRPFLSGLLATIMFAGVPAIAETPWDGPTSGPTAAEGKSIAVIAGDLKNGSILGVTRGVEEAAAAIGWEVRVLDGAGTIEIRTAAIAQALALQADGIVINGFEVAEQQAALEAVVSADIPMVGWHAGPKVGCNATGGIFANVSTDAMTVADVAAQWAIEDGGPDIGVVIFTDSTDQSAIDKADRLKETVEAKGGTVLELVDTPIADASTRMGALITSLLQKYGDGWTHALATSDAYFDFIGPAFSEAGLSPEKAPTAGSAGDGSEAAFQRIRSNGYQTVTVAEPFNLQGWQLVDELNRAIQGEACSSYVTSPAMVTQDSLAKMGESNTFEPDTLYRDAYLKIWGK